MRVNPMRVNPMRVNPTIHAGLGHAGLGHAGQGHAGQSHAGQSHAVQDHAAQGLTFCHTHDLTERRGFELTQFTAATRRTTDGEARPNRTAMMEAKD